MNAFQYISTSPLCKSDSDCDISSICCGVTSLDHSICVPLNHSDLVVLGYGGRTSEVNPALSLPIPRPIPVPPLLASLTSVSPPKSPNYIYAPNARSSDIIWMSKRFSVINGEKKYFILRLTHAETVVVRREDYTALMYEGFWRCLSEL